MNPSSNCCTVIHSQWLLRLNTCSSLRFLSSFSSKPFSPCPSNSSASYWQFHRTYRSGKWVSLEASESSFVHLFVLSIKYSLSLHCRYEDCYLSMEWVFFCGDYSYSVVLWIHDNRKHSAALLRFFNFPHFTNFRW